MYRGRYAERGQKVQTTELKTSKTVAGNQADRIKIHPEDIILPYFIMDGEDVKEPVVSMPGVFRFSIDRLVEDISTAKGVKSVLLFGMAVKKDEKGSDAYRKNGVVQKAIKAVKERFPELAVITDVCLCAYTTHGHCRIIRKRDVDNNRTLDTLARIALSHAKAGADLVAPSAMMPGQVGAIRKALDKNGFEGVRILAYSAKYASNFYEPFRDALDSSPKFGDRTSYQLDFKDPEEALKRIKQDIDEGADIVMIKPALAYLDIIYKAKQRFDVPIAAYSVSGEYSMIKKSSAGNEAIEQSLVFECISAIKRAGADFIITYSGKEIVKWLS